MKPEQKLYAKVKKFIPEISWNRLENNSLLGTPDLLGYNSSGHFFTVELKVCKGNKIRFSPHQIAFFVKHPKNSFVLVAGSPDPKLVRLYPGSRILELVDLGIKLEPLACGLAECVGLLERLNACELVA